MSFVGTIKARLRNAWQVVRDRVPLIAAIVTAIRRYIFHQSANQAGSVAFSSVLSLFPFILFLSASAAFIGEPGAAAELLRRALTWAPPAVTHALQPAIEGLLSQRNRALVSAGLFFTIWTASSAMQSVRTALNRAYDVQSSAPFWKARVKVTLLTVVGTLTTVTVFSWTVLLPTSTSLLKQVFGIDGDILWAQTGFRVVTTYVLLVALYTLLYGYLPDQKQRVRSVLPGALLGAALWLGAAWMLSRTLRESAKLTLIYGSFTGLIATLVFLYISAVTLIYGAEFNAALTVGRAERAHG